MDRRHYFNMKFTFRFLLLPSSILATFSFVVSSSAFIGSSLQNNFSTTFCLLHMRMTPTLPPVPSNVKRLFLVRHGEVINPGGDTPVYYGAMDVPLSPLGKLEAKAAADYLQQFELQHVASSPLSRAIFGAKSILELQRPSSGSTKMLVEEGFKELDRGDWCGKTKEEIGEDAMTRFDACDESVTPNGGGESYRTLKKRVLDARDHVLQHTASGMASAVVSHLQVTRCIVSDALGIPLDQITNMKIATASITCIDYHNDDKNIMEQTVQFQSFKPNVGLAKSRDGAN